MKKMKNKTARGAAHEFHRWLRKKAKETGANPDNVKLFAPDETPHGSKAWCVMWEEGPFEWAVGLAGGASMYAGELARYSLPAEIDLHGHNWHAEPHYTFDLCFYD